MKKADLQEELKKAMKAGDETKKSVLRMLLSAVTYREIKKGGAGYEASEEDVLEVVQREVKQRKDSIDQFRIGGRQDLVDKETAELEILQKYQPEQMNDAEIRVLVKDAISQTDAKTPGEMGKIMAVIMPKVKGKTDGGMVSKIVKEELA